MGTPDIAHAPSRFFSIHKSDSPAPMMLEPDHPMMQRFQDALKQHLLKQKEKLSAEILELNADCRRTQREKNDFGTRLFALKEEVAVQQRTIEERQKSLAGITAEREAMHIRLLEGRAKLKEEKTILEREIQKENDLRLQKETLHALEQKLTDWKNEMDGDVAVNLRISEKTQLDKKQLLENKRKLDMLIFRLMTEVNKLESELTLLNKEIGVKEKEKAVLNQTLADANADLQALASDQKRLLADWNAVVVAMSQRDAAHNEVMAELNASQEAFQDLNAEIESFKKSSNDEMRHSEELGVMMTKAKHDLDLNSKRLNILLERKLDLEVQVSSMSDLVMQAERDLEAAQAQTQGREAELQSVQKDLDEMNREKRRVEDEALNILLEQATNDKAATHMNKLVKELRQKTREQEVHVAEMENRTAKLFLEVEAMKGTTARNEEIIAEMNKDLDARETELGRVLSETTNIQNMISNKQGNLMILNRKIEELASRTGLGYVGLSPLQIQARDMKWKVDDLKKDNMRLQNEWLIQQHNNVKLIDERNNQLREIGLLRKQVVILEQKQMKTSQEVENEQKLDFEISRTISHLQQRLTVLCSTLADRSENEHEADRDLLLAQTAFVKSLKDSESDQMATKCEIRDLENQIEELTEAMLETQRDMLAWEKKIKLAKEAKMAIQKERSETGDIGQMQQEIHRMEVRYGQLRKVQEKLTADMEQCVYRREIILDEAEVREKRGRASNTRGNFQRKLNDLKQKIKQARQEMKAIDKLIEETQRSNEHQVNQMNEKTEHLKRLQETSRDMERQLEDGLLRKQQNLEVLVRRQRKCKLYGLLRTGKYRSLFRNELGTDNESSVARIINAKLTTVVETLVDDFPAHRVPFTRILNTLKPDAA